MNTVIPESVTAIVEKVVARHPNDIGAATNEALTKVKASPNFKEFYMSLVTHCLTELIYDARHKANVQLKRQTGRYNNKSKVDYTLSSSSYRYCYDYYVNGQTLGNILGKDLLSIANSEKEIAGGHLFNHELCTWLSTQVPDDKMVREVVSEKKLQQAFTRFRNKVEVVA
jgi:hypothetical protein